MDLNKLSIYTYRMMAYYLALDSSDNRYTLAYFFQVRDFSSWLKDLELVYDCGTPSFQY